MSPGEANKIQFVINRNSLFHLVYSIYARRVEFKLECDGLEL